MKARSSIAGLPFITNYLSAQPEAGDYLPVASGNWNDIAIWRRHDGTNYVAATDYPGQNGGTKTVSIGDGNVVTLNVSPANAIQSLFFINH